VSVLVVILAVQWTPLVLIALVGSLALLYDGQLRQERAANILADALHFRLVEAPALERIGREVDLILEQRARRVRDAPAD
jgi:hypothetical protein